MRGRFAAVAGVMFFAAALTCAAQQPSAKPLVWIDPANPYSSYLQAAVEKKHTPVLFTTLKDKAQYIATLSASATKGSAVRAVVLGAWNSGARTNLSLAVADVQTGAVVFAYTCEKNGEGHAFQSAAECLAKHWNSALKKH